MQFKNGVNEMRSNTLNVGTALFESVMQVPLHAGGNHLFQVNTWERDPQPSNSLQIEMSIRVGF